MSGFDKLFRPFNWEDWDISYHAWKRGWKTLYEPRSQVYHERLLTLGKMYSKKEIETIQWKNHFLFTWKNITSKRLLFQHFLFLPTQIIISLFLKKLTFVRGLFFALKQLREVIRKRKSVQKDFIFSDEEILEKFQW